MNIHIHVCTYNEELLLPHFMQYYTQYASKIFVHDNSSTDNTVAIATQYGAIVDTMEHDAFDDFQNLQYKHNGYKNSVDCDYVFILDCDEFLMHPALLAKLNWCKDNNIVVPTIIGYDMIYDNFDYINNSIDDVKYGVPIGTGKLPIIKSNQDILYGLGCHQLLKPIQPSYVDPDPIKFCHMKYLNLDILIDRHVNNRARFPVEYVRKGIGCHYFGDGYIIKQYAENVKNAIKVL